MTSVDKDRLNEELHAKASEFRQAILDAIPLDDIVFEQFPRGACGDTSDLLGEYFYRSQFGIWQYRCGWRKGHSHAWIEGDGLIVDITADQFDDMDEAVIVTRDQSWHLGFTPIAGDGHPALIATYDESTAQRLRSLYHRLFPQSED